MFALVAWASEQKKKKKNLELGNKMLTAVILK